MIHRGEAFARVEDAIDAARLSQLHKAALWLLAWSLRDPAVQRRDARLMARAFAADADADRDWRLCPDLDTPAQTSERGLPPFRRPRRPTTRPSRSPTCSACPAPPFTGISTTRARASARPFTATDEAPPAHQPVETSPRPAMGLLRKSRHDTILTSATSRLRPPVVDSCFCGYAALFGALAVCSTG